MYWRLCEEGSQFDSEDEEYMSWLDLSSLEFRRMRSDRIDTGRILRGIVGWMPRAHFHSIIGGNCLEKCVRN